METVLEQAARLAAVATVRRSTLAVLPAGEQRRQALVEALAPVLTARHLPDWLPAQWFAAAGEILACPDDLELYAQLDPVLDTIALELWRDGERLFGTDVWVG